MKNSGISPKCNEILEKTGFILGYDMKTYLEKEENRCRQVNQEAMAESRW